MAPLFLMKNFDYLNILTAEFITFLKNLTDLFTPSVSLETEVSSIGFNPYKTLTGLLVFL